MRFKPTSMIGFHVDGLQSYKAVLASSTVRSCRSLTFSASNSSIRCSKALFSAAASRSIRSERSRCDSKRFATLGDWSTLTAASRSSGLAESRIRQRIGNTAATKPSILSSNRQTSAQTLTPILTQAFVACPCSVCAAATRASLPHCKTLGSSDFNEQSPRKQQSNKATSSSRCFLD